MNAPYPLVLVGKRALKPIVAFASVLAAFTMVGIVRMAGSAGRTP